jgi:hypothetical protein
VLGRTGPPFRARFGRLPVCIVKWCYCGVGSLWMESFHPLLAELRTGGYARLVLIAEVIWPWRTFAPRSGGHESKKIIRRAHTTRSGSVEPGGNHRALRHVWCAGGALPRLWTPAACLLFFARWPLLGLPSRPRGERWLGAWPWSPPGVVALGFKRCDPLDGSRVVPSC